MTHLALIDIELIRNYPNHHQHRHRAFIKKRISAMNTIGTRLQITFKIHGIALYPCEMVLREGRIKILRSLNNSSCEGVARTKDCSSLTGNNKCPC